MYEQITNTDRGWAEARAKAMQDTSLQEAFRTPQQDSTVVLVRLSPREHLTLIALAAERGMDPGQWVASLTAAKLSNRPSWNQEESRHLGNVASALRQLVELLDDMQPDQAVQVLQKLYGGLVSQYERLSHAQQEYWRTAA